MHDHSESDLGAILDSRYVNITGDTMTGDLDLNNNDITNVSTINGGTISGNNSGDQDLSGLLTKTQFADIKRLGFLNRTETTISFDGTNTFTLTDAGSGWSYYRDGLKYTITGDKTVTLSATPPATADEYFIYIDATDGTLTVSTTAWTLRDSKVPVATVAFNNTLTPNYWLADERHQALLDSRMQYYLHKVDGAHLADVPTLSGYTIDTDTNAAKTVGVSQATLLDQDIIHTVDALSDPDGTTDSYVLWYRTAPSTWVWKYSKMPFAYNTSTNAIQYDSAGTLTDASSFGPGALTRWINSYLLISNRMGASRHIIVPGRAEFSTLTAAQAENVSGFDWAGFEVDEAVIAYRFTWTTYTATSLGKCMLAATPQLVELTATTTTSASIEHNNLTGIQGGTTDEYYHLTTAQVSNLHAPGSDDQDLSGYQLKSEKGEANGYASLGADGKVPTSELNPLAITSTYVVATEAAQLALDVQEGDVAVRSDLNTSFIQNGGTAGTMDDWTELLSPTASVLSVNGYTGSITLDYADVGAEPANANIQSHISSTLNPHSVTYAQVGADPAGTDNSTNVTIGTNTASALSLSGQELSLADVFVQLAGDTMTGDLTIYSNTTNPLMKLESGTDGSFPLYQLIDGRTGGKSWNIEGGRTLGNLDFYLTGSGTKMSIDENGYVGIGTSEPESILNVVWNSGNNNFLLYGSGVRQRNSGDSVSDPTPLFTIGRSRGTYASPTAVDNGDYLGVFQMGGYDGSNWVSGSAWIIARASQDWTTTTRGTDLGFSTTPNGTNSMTEKLTILNSGYIGIGTTSPTTQLSISKAVASSTYVPKIRLEDTGTLADTKTGIDWYNTTYSWSQGRISVERQGSANSFDMVLSASTSGSLIEGLRIASDGELSTSYGVAARDFTSYQTKLGVGARITGNISSAVDSHFNTSAAMSGFSWQGSPYVTPTTNTTIRDDFLYIGHSSTSQKMFYAKAVTNSAAAWQIKKAECRARLGVNANVGLRFDDGTDNNYGQIYLTSLNNGMQRLDFTYRSGGGTAVTNTSAVIVPCSQFVNMALYSYYTGGSYYALGYIFGEDGTWINIVGFNSTALANIPSAGRVGIFMNTSTSAANPALIDWYNDDFA